MNIFLSKDDKNPVYLDFKTLLEEVFPSLLIIHDGETLNKYNLQFFPPEAVIIYYSALLIDHKKLHNLLYNSKYCILITTEDVKPLFNILSLTTEIIMCLNFNKTLVDWFVKKIFSYLKNKYHLSLNCQPKEQALITSLIVSKRTSPLRFCKIFFFLQDLPNTVNYINQMDNNYRIIKDNHSNKGFMHFYKDMMINYGQKSNDTPTDVLIKIICFHKIYT